MLYGKIEKTRLSQAYIGYDLYQIKDSYCVPDLGLALTVLAEDSTYVYGGIGRLPSGVSPAALKEFDEIAKESQILLDDAGWETLTDGNQGALNPDDGRPVWACRRSLAGYHQG